MADRISFLRMQAAITMARRAACDRRVTWLILAALMAWPALAAGAAAPPANTQNDSRSLVAAAGVPFVENRGLGRDSNVAFLAETFAATVMVERDGAVSYGVKGTESKPFLIRERFSREKLSPEGTDPAAVQVSYFRGNDPEKWRTKLPTFQSIRVADVSKGVSLSLQAFNDNVEKIFTVSPGADPTAISVAVEGIAALKLGPAGELEMHTAKGPLTFSAPVAYQVKGGSRHPVEVSYQLGSEHSYGFYVGAYDRTQPLIIDPIIASTYIGRDSRDYGFDVVVDGDGNVYAAGHSTDFNTSPYQTTAGSYSAGELGDIDVYFGKRDAVVSKFDPTLGQLLASTFVGGAEDDGAFSIVFEAATNPMDDDHILVAGLTWSPDFPMVEGSNAFDTVHNGSSDLFVLRLDTDLSTLIASTYVGGTDLDNAFATSPSRGPRLAVDAAGDIYVTGTTNSFDFPVIPPGKDQGYTPFQDVNQGDGDAFVIKLSNNLEELMKWTFLGGGQDESGTAIATVGDRVLVAGHTESAENWLPPPYQPFPTTLGAFDVTHNSRSGVLFEDGFLSRFDADLETLQASTFIGGDGGDLVWDMAVDPINGWVYIAGATDSGTFPTTPTAYMPTRYAPYNGFVAKLNIDLDTLLAGTYLGGRCPEALAETMLHGLALDGYGAVWVTGRTWDDFRPTFPVTNIDDPDLPVWYDPVHYAWKDVVLTRFNHTLERVDDSLHVGGSDHQEAWGIFCRNVQRGGDVGQAVEVSVTGWSKSGTPNDRFYPVFLGEPGFTDSFDYFAENDDVLVTKFLFSESPLLSDGFEPARDRPCLDLAMTVMVDNGNNECGTERSLTLTLPPPGAPQYVDVRYCYTATNTGNTAFRTHSLVDNQQTDPLFTDLPNVLNPGADMWVTNVVRLTASATNTGTWTAENILLNRSVSASDTISVIVRLP